MEMGQEQKAEIGETNGKYLMKDIMSIEVTFNCMMQYCWTFLHCSTKMIKLSNRAVTMHSHNF